MKKLGIKIKPAQVRLQPGVEDGYVWSLVPEKEHLFKEYLFTKQLSKHSYGAYAELCCGVGVSSEAAVNGPTLAMCIVLWIVARDP